MKLNRWILAVPALLAALALTTVGCRQQANPEKEVAKDGHDKDKDKEGHGWWCADHGIPEEMCSLCSAEVAKQCKEKGDWCELHDRAKSQCFKCDPSKFDRFAAMYKAKYGKDAPRPPEEEFKK